METSNMLRSVSDTPRLSQVLFFGGVGCLVTFIDYSQHCLYNGLYRRGGTMPPYYRPEAIVRHGLRFHMLRG